MNDTLKVAGRIGAELGAAKAELEKLRGLLHGAHDTIRNLAEDLDEDEFQATIDQLAEIELALGQQQTEPYELDYSYHSHEFAKAQTEPTDTYTAVDMVTAAAQGFRDGQAAVEPAPAQDERVSFDDVRGTVTIFGAVYAQELLQNLGQTLPVGEMFRLVGRNDGVVTVEHIRPAQTEQQPPYPHEAMDVIATSRYQVVASGSGPLSRYYVRAGDGKCELYRGGKSDCEHVARKLAGAFLDGGLTAFGLYAAPIAQTAPQGKFRMGDRVKKSTGSEWVGRVCGWYSTEQTKEGYAVESEAHKGSVQIYPAKALEAVE